ncbi:hypothetical protein OSB04_030114 [Centaurea solstitialis]|uniref:Uncharacterized protein n=1 Tax=Centaurea solstitialis TaxID=347529 RepID=A0AA38W6T8_9ASTR|nr:hypothetical protein OSB04_030114 [Centaurea solstitialis]
MAWCRCLVLSLASITPINSTRFPSPYFVRGKQPNEIWQSTSEDASYLKVLETKWNGLLSKMKDVVTKRPSEENLEAVTMLLRSSYNFYQDFSCALLPSCLNLYPVPLTEGNSQSNMHAVDTLEMNKMKKLLLWAYALLHGHCVTNVSVIIKYCEETSLNDEPQQESRSGRLERLRSRKPDKEEPVLTVTKDLIKLVSQFLDSFIYHVKDTWASCRCSEVTTNAQNNESVDVAKSVYETSKHYGAYHIGHLLLEEIACRGIPLLDSFEKFLELEQLTRNSGENRSPECTIFLAELSYDFGIKPSTSTDFMSRASYHLCKLIETVAVVECLRIISALKRMAFQFVLCWTKKRALWVCFFWLSGKLSIFNADKEKSSKGIGVALALFIAKDKESNPLVSISLKK